MILIPLLALLLGILLGTILALDVSPTLAPYLAVSTLAGLDSVFGGSRSVLEGKFKTSIFLTGFLANIALAVFLIWLGTGLGLSLVTVAGLVFGIRIFMNLSIIRRLILERVERKNEPDYQEESESLLEQGTNL